MKLLKWLVAAAVALGVVFVVGGLLLPSSTHVERSVTIRRPPADIYALLNSYRRFNEWSPWFALEPNARYVVSGPEAGVGAHLSWVGEKVGTGTQHISASVPDSKVVNMLDFDGRPAIGTFTLVPGHDGTRVTWAFDSRHGANLPSRWLGPLVEGWVGADYEKGLARLKALLEAD